MVKTTVKRVLRTLQHAPDRAAHALRRQQVARRWRGRVPSSVLFVCHGNICRSPFAAFLFARLATERLPGRIDTLSAGFIGPGRGSPPQALAASERRDIDLTSHRSRLLTDRLIRKAELVIVMSAEQERAIRRLAGQNVIVLGDLDPESIRERTIMDPWGGSDDDFDASYARIERCVRELVRLLADDNSGSAD